MAYQLTIQPSGLQCDAKAYDTLLDTAIAAGVNLPYGCKNGACGSCKGQILSGEVDYGDYVASVLTPVDIAAGRALFCCARPLSDVVIECRETVAGITQPRIMPARVEQKTQLSHDVMALSLKLASSEHLQFKAGQYLEFLLKDGQRRAFSIANAPHIDQMLELHLRLVPGGQFTEYVFNEMQPKAIVRIEAPLGQFYLREDSNKPIIMVAGGTGFAPIKGIIEYMLHENITREITLYWGARTLADLYMADLPISWASQHAHIRFIPVLSEPQASDAWTGRTGLVHEAVLDDMAAKENSHFESNDFAAYEVYCCGAPAMVEVAQANFVAAGLPVDAFFADAFTFAKPVVSTT